MIGIAPAATTSITNFDLVAQGSTYCQFDSPSDFYNPLFVYLQTFHLICIALQQPLPKFQEKLTEQTIPTPPVLPLSMICLLLILMEWRKIPMWLMREVVHWMDWHWFRECENPFHWSSISPSWEFRKSLKKLISFFLLGRQIFLGAGSTLTLAGVCGDVFVFKSSYVFFSLSSPQVQIAYFFPCAAGERWALHLDLMLFWREEWRRPRSSGSLLLHWRLLGKISSELFWALTLRVSLGKWLVSDSGKVLNEQPWLFVRS